MPGGEAVVAVLLVMAMVAVVAVVAALEGQAVLLVPAVLL